MDPEKKNKLSLLLLKLIERNVDEPGRAWLMEKSGLVKKESQARELNITFSAIPRKISKELIHISDEEEKQLQELLPGLSIQGWDTHRLCRVWLLMQVDDAEKENYLNKVESLFRAAEMNELVALYSALPVLSFPEDWTARCAEGIRSNIGTVLEAIMLNNPYPFLYLSVQAWNQLVLKAFFTEKDISRIYGLKQKANKELALTLLDYAHERMAAKRTVNARLWPLIEQFMVLGPAEKNY